MIDDWSMILAIAAGGALGALARYGVGLVVSHLLDARRLVTAFPAGTFVVNVSGALAIGLVFGLAGRSSVAVVDSIALNALVVGGLGAYTTVSTFSLQTVMLMRSGRPALALVNAGATAIATVAAAGAGFALVATAGSPV